MNEFIQGFTFYFNLKFLGLLLGVLALIFTIGMIVLILGAIGDYFFG